MRSRSISTEAASGFSENSRNQKEHTKEIKGFSDGNFTGRFSLVEGYEPSVRDVKPVKTITVHMCELGKSELHVSAPGAELTSSISSSPMVSQFPNLFAQASTTCRRPSRSIIVSCSAKTASKTLGAAAKY